MADDDSKSDSQNQLRVDVRGNHKLHYLHQRFSANEGRFERAVVMIGVMVKDVDPEPEKK